MATINEYGEIINMGVVEKEPTQEDLLKKELGQLQYEIFSNHGNPDKSPEKLARYQELQKILGIDLEHGDKAAALKRAQLKMQAKIDGQNKPSIFDLARAVQSQKE